jgi:hypothetical protein
MVPNHIWPHHGLTPLCSVPHSRFEAAALKKQQISLVLGLKIH